MVRSSESVHQQLAHLPGAMAFSGNPERGLALIGEGRVVEHEDRIQTITVRVARSLAEAPDASEDIVGGLSQGNRVSSALGRLNRAGLSGAPTHERMER